MQWDEVFGYAGALLTGFVLGLLGGGGALLSIPVLVYFFHLEASVATGYSLFLVGVTASLGAIQNLRKQLVDFRLLLGYGIPSVITVYCMRRFLVPNLPDVLFTYSNFSLSKNHFILLILSVVMIVAGYRMIASASTSESPADETNFVKLILYAILIGAFLGLVGAGGGFLMIPALVLFGNLPMKKAIGTSLVLVALNSFIGFLGDVHANAQMDWKFLFTFSAFSISGIFLGSFTAGKIDGQKLKQYFGWFMIAMALYIVYREFFKFSF